MGGGGFAKWWHMMTGGRGAYEIMTSSIKEVFCSSIQKRSLKVNCSMPRRLSISDSNCAWNSFQKEHHIACCGEKIYAEWRGVSKKWRQHYGGFLEMMTHDDRGEGGVKNCQNGGDVICGVDAPKLSSTCLLLFSAGMCKIICKSSLNKSRYHYSLDNW